LREGASAWPANCGHVFAAVLLLKECWRSNVNPRAECESELELVGA
jgi:hypothetical protein